MSKLKKIISDVNFLLSFIWKNDKLIFPLKIFGVILNTTQSVFSAFYIKWIIDCLQSNTDIIDIIKLILLIQIAFFVIYTLSTIINRIVISKREYKLKFILQKEFINKAMHLDLECYENFDYYDNFTKAMRIADTKSIEILNNITTIFECILSSVALLSVIGMLSPIILLFVLVIIVISFFDEYNSSRLSNELYISEQTLNRESDYIKKISHHRQFAKEVRIFSMYPFIFHKLNESFAQRYKYYENNKTKYWRFKYFISFIKNLIIIPALMIYLSYLVINNILSLGSFSVLFSSAFIVSNYFVSLLSAFSDIKFQSDYYVSHLRNIYEHESEIEVDSGNKLPILGNEQHEIVFKNVYFHYPNHDEQVLNNLSFKLKKGEKLSIVGRNGSGKSTIIKLLLRLYDVDSGEILIDNKNIKEYLIEDLRKCFSCVMQDFNIYGFTFAENILMKQYDIGDEKIVKQALEFSGLFNKVSKIPKKENTYVSREFHKDGVELSGGQFQKLAISRAVSRSSNILIFDEANSSLDPESDYELNMKIYSKYVDKTVIFISHRLSSTIMADKILFLDKGTIVEEGTHAELMERKGEYFKMFEKQYTSYSALKEEKNYE